MVSQGTRLAVLSANIPEGGFEKCPREKKEEMIWRKEGRPTWMGPPLKRPLRRRPRTWTLSDLMRKAVEKKRNVQQDRTPEEKKMEEVCPVELYDATRGGRTTRSGWTEIKLIGAPLQMFHNLQDPTVEELAKEMAKDNWPFRISQNFFGYELRLKGCGGGKKRKKQAIKAQGEEGRALQKPADGGKKKQTTPASKTKNKKFSPQIPPAAGAKNGPGPEFVTPQKKKKMKTEASGQGEKVTPTKGKNKRAKRAATGAPPDSLRFILDGSAGAEKEQEEAVKTALNINARLKREEQQRQEETARLQKEKEDIAQLRRLLEEDKKERARMQRLREDELKQLKDNLRNELKTLKEERERTEAKAREAKAAEGERI